MTLVKLVCVRQWCLQYETESSIFQHIHIYFQAWELYAHWRIYAPRYIQYAPRLSKKRKIKINLFASFHFGVGRLALVVLVNPLASESVLFLGMRNVIGHCDF